MNAYVLALMWWLQVQMHSLLYGVDVMVLLLLQSRDELHAHTQSQRPGLGARRRGARIFADVSCKRF